MSGRTSDDRVERLEVYLVDLSQEKPYLGSLREGETVNDAGYFVRKGNRTVYPLKNRSLVVKLVTKDGITGWGETYGLVAPKATAEIMTDLLAGFVVGQDPFLAERIHDTLYDLMRVRGYTGGFYMDALAAIDIALWDIKGKAKGKPVSQLLGKKPAKEIPAYVSGLPEDTLAARCKLAADWQTKGFNAFKFALPVADEGAVKEIRGLRETLGDPGDIACDLHWSLEPGDAIQLAKDMAPYRPWFLEAPVAPEDLIALVEVAEWSGQRIAVGEEWRTVHDAKLRINADACDIVQPEMGHTGITQFMRIGKYAMEKFVAVNPHATIGSGIFLAASLQATSVLEAAVGHEFQHSIFEPFRHFTGDVLDCREGAYTVPKNPGIGVEPSEAMLANMQRIG